MLGLLVLQAAIRLTEQNDCRREAAFSCMTATATPDIPHAAQAFALKGVCLAGRARQAIQGNFRRACIL